MAETTLYLIFCSLSCVFWPIYLVILLCIIYDRTKSSHFSTTFYNLVISLGIGDLLAMLSYLYIRLARNQFPELYWEHRQAYWAAPFGYNQIFYWLFIRAFGAALISFQRYLIVCQSTTRLCKIMNGLSFWQIFLIHWIPPTIYSLPIITNTNITYDSSVTFNTLLATRDIQYASYSGAGFTLVTFVVCVTLYFLVIRTFRTASMNKNLRKEMRITIQVVGPVLALTCAFFNDLFLLIFAILNKPELTYFMRNMYPITTGFMSYINPITYLVFSEDLRKLIWNTFVCKKYQVENNSSKGPIGSRTTPQILQSSSSNANNVQILF